MEPRFISKAWVAVSGGPAKGPAAGIPGEEAWQDPPGTAADAWFRVTIGKTAPKPKAQAEEPRASSRDSLDGTAGGSSDRANQPKAPGEEPGPATVTSTLVTEGMTLWRLAEQRYGQGNNPELLEALARHNRLESLDRLEIGQRIWLPPLDQLLGER